MAERKGKALKGHETVSLGTAERVYTAEAGSALFRSMGVVGG